MKACNQFLFVFTLCFSSSVFACGVVKVGVVDWPPFQIIENDGSQGVSQYSGIDVEAVKASFALLGCKVVFVNKPWARLLEEINSGALDVLPGMSWTEERSEQFDFSISYRTERIGLFYRNLDPRVAGLENLQDIVEMDLVLGVPRNSYLGRDFNELMKVKAFRNQVMEMVGGTNLKFLVHERVDLLLDDFDSLMHRVSTEGLSHEIGYFPELVVSNGDVYFMLRKDLFDQSMLGKLNKAIQERIE